MNKTLYSTPLSKIENIELSQIAKVLKYVKTDFRMLSYLLEEHLKNNGMIDIDRTNRFDAIFKNLHDLSDFPGAAVFEMETYQHIGKPVHLENCEDKINGVKVVYKNIYTRRPNKPFILEYNTGIGHYIYEGWNGGDIPTGMCVESSSHIHDDIFTHSKRYGNFTNGKKDGEFILFLEKNLYTFGKKRVSCGNNTVKTIIHGYFIYEKYVNDVLIGARLKIKISNGKMKNCATFEQSDIHGSIIDEETLTSKIETTSPNEICIVTNRLNMCIKYRFHHDGADFIPRSISTKCQMIRVNHVFFNKMFILNSNIESNGHYNNDLHFLDRDGNIELMPSDTSFHFH